MKARNRSLIGSLAALVLMASTAAGQGDGSFTYVGGPADLNRLGRWNSDFAGGDVLSPPTIGTSFAIFCVDPNHYVSDGNTYNAWNTQIAQTNADIATQTRLGLAGVGNAYDRYWRAAYLVDQFLINGSINNSDYQNAIWYITSGGSFGVNNSYASTANGLATNATGFSQFSVITDVNSIRDGGKQEFIWRGGGGGQEIVPEPATMTLLATGLVGMAAASRRRRQK